jgi:iron complex outermembrane receptor protein
MRTAARHAVFIGATGALLTAAQAQGVQMTLDAIDVESRPIEADTRGQILSGSTVSATKTKTPVLETSQSVSTVTRRQIDEQDPQTVGETLRYTSGVLSDRDTNARYDSIFLRGFGSFGTTTSYVDYLDGLRLPRGQAFAQTAIDPYLLDHIDVLKGPNAVLYGQVSPGGLVNQIGRAPSAVPFNEVFVEGGSYGRIQTGLTTRGALNKDATLQYGVSMIGRTSGTRYDGVDEKRFSIAPSIRWTPDAATSLTLSGYHQNDPKGGYFNSLYPTFLAPSAYRSYLSRNLNVGDPNYDSFKRDESGIGYAFEHHVNEVVTLRSALRYSDVGLDFRSLQMAGPLAGDGVIPRQALRSIESVGGVSTDNQAEFDFTTGTLGHKAIAGIDDQNATSDWRYLYAPAPSLSVTGPVYGRAMPALFPIINSRQNLEQLGLYAQDQISFGGFRATLGLRHDRAQEKTLDRIAGTSEDQDNGATTYKAGLLYLFDNGFAPYVSYATSFEPTVGVSSGSVPFVPSTAKQYEAGVKVQPPGWNLLLTASAFDIRKQKALVPDALGFSVQEGEIASRGLEFESRGQLTDSFEVVAALTLLDTRVTKTALAANLDRRPEAVPDAFTSLWGTYSFHTGALTGLSLGGGLRVVGSSYADNANRVKAPAYGLLDASLRYDLGAAWPEWKGVEARLNVSNLLDKTYYSSCSSDFYCQYGDGRRILASLRKTW